MSASKISIRGLRTSAMTLNPHWLTMIDLALGSERSSTKLAHAFTPRVAVVIKKGIILHQLTTAQSLKTVIIALLLLFVRARRWLLRFQIRNFDFVFIFARITIAPSHRYCWTHCQLTASPLLLDSFLIISNHINTTQDLSFLVSCTATMGTCGLRRTIHFSQPSIRTRKVNWTHRFQTNAHNWHSHWSLGLFQCYESKVRCMRVWWRFGKRVTRIDTKDTYIRPAGVKLDRLIRSRFVLSPAAAVSSLKRRQQIGLARIFYRVVWRNCVNTRADHHWNYLRDWIIVNNNQ